MRLTPEEEQERYELYKKGYSDAEIGKRCFLDRTSVRTWRISRGYSANFPKGNPKGRLNAETH